MAGIEQNYYRIKVAKDYNLYWLLAGRLINLPYFYVACIANAEGIKQNR